MAKKKTFSMHPKLLMDTIKRQAGTLGKAVLEGVMNSVDAGSTWCDVTLDEEVIIIEDDGGGFPDEQTVDHCFNTFGQPHDASENKVYANFRMGRGQMFAFGHNVWESGVFLFDVDIQTRGLDWDFHEDEDMSVEGCRITIYLYEKMLPSELGQLERDLRKLVKWVSIPVTLNDEPISKDPAEATWDYESDSCYVKLKSSGDLDVYNLGAYVKGFPSYTYGRGGEVVSKQQLKLNFARNDVMVRECPIWKEVIKFVQNKADVEIKRKKSLNDSERQRLATELLTGGMDQKAILNTKLLTDVSGRHHSPLQLCNNMHKYPVYSSAMRGDRRGDMVQQHGLGFVFATDTLDRFCVDSPRDLLDLLRRKAGSPDLMFGWRYMPFDQLTKGLKTSFQLVEEKQWHINEKIWMRVASNGVWAIRSVLCGITGMELRQRKILLGSSDAAEGWTDGQTYIALERRWLRKLAFNDLGSFVSLGELMLHEYCHEDDDSETHTHSPEFYSLYHDATHRGAVAKFASNAFDNMPKVMEYLQRRMTKAMLRGRDKTAKLNKATDKLMAARPES